MLLYPIQTGFSSSFRQGIQVDLLDKLILYFHSNNILADCNQASKTSCIGALSFDRKDLSFGDLGLADEFLYTLISKNFSFQPAREEAYALCNFSTNRVNSKRLA